MLCWISTCMCSTECNVTLVFVGDCVFVCSPICSQCYVTCSACCNCKCCARYCSTVNRPTCKGITCSCWIVYCFCLCTCAVCKLGWVSTCVCSVIQCVYNVVFVCSPLCVYCRICRAHLCCCFNFCTCCCRCVPTFEGVTCS